MVAGWLVEVSKLLGMVEIACEGVSFPCDLVDPIGTLVPGIRHVDLLYKVLGYQGGQYIVE